MAKTEMTLTPEGRQKLVDELEWREGEKNNEIIEAIKEARAQGDLKGRPGQKREPHQRDPPDPGDRTRGRVR